MKFVSVVISFRANCQNCVFDSQLYWDVFKSLYRNSTNKKGT